MPKYEVTVNGHSTKVTNYRATLTVEAESEEEAKEQALDLAEDSEVEWVETDMTVNSDYDEIVIDDAEVEAEIDEEENESQQA